jgi:hypothetical protein
MRGLGAEELLAQLPVLQRLLGRLVDCRPNGAAAQDHVVQVGGDPFPGLSWLWPEVLPPLSRDALLWTLTEWW